MKVAQDGTWGAEIFAGRDFRYREKLDSLSVVIVDLAVGTLCRDRAANEGLCGHVRWKWGLDWISAAHLQSGYKEDAVDGFFALHPSINNNIHSNHCSHSLDKLSLSIPYLYLQQHLLISTF